MEILLAETNARLHWPPVLVPMPQLFQSLVFCLLVWRRLVTQPKGY